MAKTFTGMGGHHAPVPETVEWLTPPDELARLGPFGLDPCVPERWPPGWRPTAPLTYCRRDNGLTQPWPRDLRVWLNPPYTADEIAAWLARLADHGRGIGLIFARTDTAAFHRQVFERAHGVLFREGRINFHFGQDWTDPRGRRFKAGDRCPKNSGAPSAYIAYGAEELERLADSGIPGALVPLIVPASVLVPDVPLPTWRELVESWCEGREAVTLAELYAIARGHPKARGNRNVEAKVRQQLQMFGTPLGGGRWSLP